MNNATTGFGLAPERGELTEGEKKMFLSDFKRLYEQYFEGDGKPDINLTRTADGFSVCIIFAARRIMNFKSV